MVNKYKNTFKNLTPTNSLFIKTGFLKLNEMFSLQIYQLMQNTVRGFEVDQAALHQLVQSIHTIPDFQ